MLQVTELRPADNFSTNILWSFSDLGNTWVRQVVILPNITHKYATFHIIILIAACIQVIYRYYLHFDAKKGIKFIGDIAIDDVSLSPECFGLNIPESELNGYNYWNPWEEISTREPHKDFINQTGKKIFDYSDSVFSMLIVCI